jgi:hypothetical protein
MCALDSSGSGYYPDAAGGKEDNCLSCYTKGTKLLGQQSGFKLLKGWAP